jgi:alginate O-acetyltransferase complex protein AlgI
VAQNVLLLVASVVFYAWWDWRFVGLLAVSTGVDFTIGRALHQATDATRRTRLLAGSLVVNLGILGFFKYAGFFADSLVVALQSVGLEADPLTLHIILPVGISFYTFQTLSYTIDIYRRRLQPTQSLLEFAVFVAFFPQLVAGPIERAKHFLPQVARPRTITASAMEHGLVLVTWGLFKKVVLADNAAKLADPLFDAPAAHAGLDLWLAALAFTLQIYGDFSGYSDIARGLARWLGFDLMVNFRLPYFARGPSDFWRRWHISLSTWLRDYLYISLGGNRGTPWHTYRNLVLTMLLGGLWHGARWNFVLWGAYHGFILVLARALKPLTARLPDRPTIALVQWALMFGLTVWGWVLFRVVSFSHLVDYTAHLGTRTSPHTAELAFKLVLLWTPLWLVQLVQHFTGDLLVMRRGPWPVAALFVTACVVATLVFGVHEPVEFLYFQF